MRRSLSIFSPVAPAAPAAPAAQASRARGLAGLVALVGLAALVGMVLAGPALAQSASCEQGGKLLSERKSIIAQINSHGKKIDAKTACGIFGKLVTNGAATVKWVDANKDWCSIPDSFVEGMKGDHAKATDLRSKACSVVAKQAELEKKARQQAAKQAQSGGGNGGGGGGGLLGGPGLTGESKIPQGAL